MTLAELAAVSLASWLASLAIVAYVMDAVGLAISPAVALIAATATVGVMVGKLRLADAGRLRHRDGGPPKPDAKPEGSALHSGGAIVWAAIVTLVFAWLLWLAWPALLPPGRGPDLTHHLLLIDYIERHWRLAHDPALAAAMGEMAAYTPGSHLLAVLAGAWTRTDGFRAVYPIVAFTVALKTGFLFLIARRALPDGLPRTPLALVAVLLVLLPRAYFIEAFTHDSFLAQVVAELFAVAMWWAVMAWDERPSTATAAIVALMGAAVFLTWPIWIGPPALVCLFVMLTPRPSSRETPEGRISLRTRVWHLAIAMSPIAVVAIAHVFGRLGWVMVVRTSGAVMAPSLAAVGWAFPLLGFAGLAASIRSRRVRPTVLLLAAIAVQAAALYAVAKANGAPTPYMALKMAYLAIYPMAVLGALAVAWPLTGSWVHRFKGSWVPTSAMAWGVVGVLAVAIARPVLAVPRPVPVVTRDLYDAGRWTRANVGAACVDYLVSDADTAYWLHLAVLGNPRTSDRTAAVDRHDGRAATARWITDEGLPYAICDLTALPDEVRSRVELVKQFGGVGVIKRPGGAGCDGR